MGNQDSKGSKLSQFVIFVDILKFLLVHNYFKEIDTKFSVHFIKKRMKFDDL